MYSNKHTYIGSDTLDVESLAKPVVEICKPLLRLHKEVERTTVLDLYIHAVATLFIPNPPIFK